jgi:hypothetical protein
VRNEASSNSLIEKLFEKITHVSRPAKGSNALILGTSDL